MEEKNLKKQGALIEHIVPRVSITNFSTSNGWYHDPSNGAWYYYINGAYQTGWFYDPNNNWVYFESNGEMVENTWIQDKGAWYYLGSDGIMETNAWVQSPNTGNWYYVGANGAMETDTEVDGWNIGPNGVATKSNAIDGNLDGMDTALIDYNYYLNRIGFTMSNSGSYTYDSPNVTITATTGVVYNTNEDAQYKYTLNNGQLTSISDEVISVGDFANFNITINGQNLIAEILSFSYGDFGISWSSSNPNGITLSFVKKVINENNHVVEVELKVEMQLRALPARANNDVCAIQNYAISNGETAVIIGAIVLIAIALGPLDIAVGIFEVVGALT